MTYTLQEKKREAPQPGIFLTFLVGLAAAVIANELRPRITNITITDSGGVVQTV